MAIGDYAAWFAVVACAWAAPASGEETPKYQLSAGRELTYQALYTVTKAGAPPGEVSRSRVDWKVWATRRDPDGAWRLVIQCETRDLPGKPVERPEPGPVSTLFWRCRLYPDGRLVGATIRGNFRNPFRLFPRLPDRREGGWESDGPSDSGIVFRHRRTPGTEAEGLSITSTAEGPEDTIWPETHSARSTFDIRRSVVTRVETEDVSAYGSPQATRGIIELAGVEERGGEWASSFGRDADRYFDAVAAYEQAGREAVRDATRCGAILLRAKSRLEEARAGLSTPAFRDALTATLAKHDGLAADYAEEAEDHRDRLGKPSPPWEAKGLDGKIHRPADYRGKVVVMDFWYRGCGWCMHAMPQVKRLAETFRDRPVAVLGMSIDEDEKDARIVVDAMGLNYPTIRAIGIPEQYGVKGYPTLVVLDQTGKIREIHVGFSATLHDDLAASIRKLLDEPPR